MFQSSAYQSIISSMWTPPSKGSVLEWGMFLAQALHLVQICQRSVIQSVTIFTPYLNENTWGDPSELDPHYGSGKVVLAWKRSKVNLLVRGSGPDCGKGSSSQETPGEKKTEKSDKKERRSDISWHVNLPGCVVDWAEPFFVSKCFSLASQPDNPQLRAP